MNIIRLLVVFLCLSGISFAATVSDVQTIDGAQRQKIQSAIDGATNGLSGGSSSQNAITNAATYGGESAQVNYGISNQVLYLKPPIPGQNMVIIDSGTNLVFSVTNVLTKSLTAGLSSFSTNISGPFLITGTTFETNALAFNIPAGVIGSNGFVKTTCMWERRTGSGSRMSLIRMGSGGATNSIRIARQSASTSNMTDTIYREMWALNSHTNMISPNDTLNGFTAVSGLSLSVTDSTINSMPVYFNVVPVVAAETNILWGVHVNVIYQP